MYIYIIMKTKDHLYNRYTDINSVASYTRVVLVFVV